MARPITCAEEQANSKVDPDLAVVTGMLVGAIAGLLMLGLTHSYYYANGFMLVSIPAFGILADLINRGGRHE